MKTVKCSRKILKNNYSLKAVGATKIHHYNNKTKKWNQQTPEAKRAHRKRKYQENPKRNKKYQKGGA